LSLVSEELAAYNYCVLKKAQSLMTALVRLAKRLAEIVPCSRREAEIYIESGWVSVDGRVITEPQFKVSNQNVELDAKAALVPIEPVTILFHRPVFEAPEIDVQQMSTDINAESHAPDDPSGVLQSRRHYANLTLVLPLQNASSGLVVLTQDWRVLRKLVEDAATVEQEYIAEIDGKLGAHGLQQLNGVVNFAGRTLPVAKVSWQNETRLRIAIKNPQVGQIGRLCESVGLQVLSLKRIRIGKVSMAKLPVGKWRYLPSGERF
jgi:23S rRNA pseudouridine2604 synthase